MNNFTRMTNGFGKYIKAAIVAGILTTSSGCISGPSGGVHPFATMFSDYQPPHTPQLVRTSELPTAPMSQTAIQ